MFRIKATNVLMLCIGEAVVYDDASDWFFFFFLGFFIGGGGDFTSFAVVTFTVVYYNLLHS